MRPGFFLQWAGRSDLQGAECFKCRLQRPSTLPHAAIKMAKRAAEGGKALAASANRRSDDTVLARRCICLDRSSECPDGSACLRTPYLSSPRRVNSCQTRSQGCSSHVRLLRGPRRAIEMPSGFSRSGGRRASSSGANNSQVKGIILALRHMVRTQQSQGGIRAPYPVLCTTGEY